MSMDPERAIEVFLCESNDIYRLGVKYLLQNCPSLKLVGEVGDPKLASVMLRESCPEVVVIDTFEEQWNPLWSLASLELHCKIVAFSSAPNAEDFLTCLRAGITAYLSKFHTNGLLLTQAISAAANGNSWFCRRSTDKLLQVVNSDFNCLELPKANEPSVDLSDRELDVMKHLVDGLSNQAIAKKLAVSPETVKSHLKKIMNKLQVSSRTLAAVKAIELGLTERIGDGAPPDMRSPGKPDGATHA